MVTNKQLAAALSGEHASTAQASVADRLSESNQPGRTTSAPVNRRPSGRRFYLAMALVVAAVVAVGFGPKLDARLIHPASPRPSILLVHAVWFTAWVLIFIVQTAAVRVRRIDWHIRVGILGVAIGAVLPILGIATALVMTRLEAGDGDAVEGEAFLVVSFFDMLAFASTFWLAVHLRGRPDYHRRLMLMASCGLTAAAFARFPRWLMPDNAWYLGVDALLLAAVIRDLIVERRLHRVYAVGLPVLFIGQGMAMWIYLSRTAGWLAFAHFVLR